MDILRSLAHELVHYKQDVEDRLHHTSGQTGSEHENEAHAVAGQIMRLYGKKHPELF
jgi:Zn-dependent peptidase ImmA (M78 family)